MPNPKKWRIVAPVGNLIVAKDQMTEQELRDYGLSLIQDTDDQSKTWEEKVKKDPIENVTEWLEMQGYTITEV